MFFLGLLNIFTKKITWLQSYFKKIKKSVSESGLLQIVTPINKSAPRKGFRNEKGFLSLIN